MTKEELEKKSETEGLTAEEVTEYRKLVKPVRHVYGKYGTMKKKYLEEHDWVKTAALGKICPNICTRSTERRMTSTKPCMKS